MRRKLIVPLIIIFVGLLLSSFAFSIDEHELPYGVYYNMGWLNVEPAYEIIDSFDFNFIIDKAQSEQVIDSFYTLGMEYIFSGAHQDGSGKIEDWHRYSFASYGLWEGESTYSKSSRRLLLHHPTSSGGDLQWLRPVDDDVYNGDVQEWCEDCDVGSGVDSIYYICNDDTSGNPQLVLCGPKPPHFEADPRHLRDDDDTVYIDFAVKADTDDNPNNNDDDVCYLDVGIFDKWGSGANFIRLDSVYLDENAFIDSSGSLTWRLNYNFAQDEIPDSVKGKQSYYVACHVVTAANRKLSVDKVAIYDEVGKKIFTNDQRTMDDIKESIDSSWARPPEAIGYYQRGELYYYQYHIHSIIDDSVQSSTGNSAFSFTEFLRYKEDIDFFHYVNPDLICVDFYYLKCKDGVQTHYTEDDAECGLQTKMNWWLNRHMYHRKVLGSYPNTEWWVVPEPWAEIDSTGSYGAHRLPTKSDLRCNVGLALCMGVDGLAFFMIGHDEAQPGSFSGLLDTTGVKTPCGEVMQEKITPWIKSIDSTYLSLDWDTTYTISPGRAIPVEATLVDTVTWRSDTTALANPDAGWFQITEFRDTTLNANCLLVVNRACNNQFGDEAPPIHATIALNLAHFVSRRYLAVNVDGRMNEKYTVDNENNELKFTTTLEAGEAKLFRIEDVNR